MIEEKPLKKGLFFLITDMNNTSLNDLQNKLLEEGPESLIQFASDPNSSDETLVFCFFFLPQIVDQNPAWILIKMSTDIGKIAKTIFNYGNYDKFAAYIPTDTESLRLINDIGGLTQQILLVFGRQNNELDLALDDILPEEGVDYEGKKVDPAHKRLSRWNRSENSPKLKKMLSDHNLSFDKLFSFYVAFPEKAKQNPAWNILKNMTPEEIANIVIKHDIDVASVAHERPFKTADEWLEYANFLLPVANKIMANPESGGGDYEVSHPVYYRLTASIKANPEEFTEEKIMSGITDPKHVNHIKRIFADIDK